MQHTLVLILVGAFKHVTLLCTNSQAGNSCDNERELLIEKIFLQDTTIDLKEKIIATNQKPAANECQNLSVELNAKKCPLPRLLTVTDWSNGMLESTLNKTYLTRGEKWQIMRVYLLQQQFPSTFFLSQRCDRCVKPPVLFQRHFTVHLRISATRFFSSKNYEKINTCV